MDGFYADGNRFGVGIMFRVIACHYQDLDIVLLS